MREKAKILVVDDEAGFRDLLTYELGERGHEAAAAADGEEALERLRAKTFDIVVSDMTMPKLDGLGLLSETRKLARSPEVIVITGNATIESAVECMRRGAYDFITKPFQVEDLLRLVERAVEKGRLQREVGELFSRGGARRLGVAPRTGRPRGPGGRRRHHRR